MADSGIDHNAAIAEFCGVTGADSETASNHLATNQWNVSAAVTNFYTSMDETSDGDVDDEDDVVMPGGAATSTSGPRTLGGEGVPSRAVASTTTSSSGPSSQPTTKPKQSKKQFKSLQDLQSGPSGAAGGDDEDDEQDQEYFAGGDKSGLAVQEPGSGARDRIQRLLETARRNGPPPPRETQQQSRFTGTGVTLGGDDAPSQTIPDPNANVPRPEPMAERVLHIWADGFSVDDGPLYRYDDPANARILDMINRGSAPLDILNVRPGQEVDVKLETHKGENYVVPKKKYTPFSGGGQRLGSPVPGASGAAATTQASTSSSSTATTSNSNTLASSIDVDDSQPVITLQIRLADGTRLPSRFNTTHTIGDVYDFVARANANSSQRNYSLATTFPTKELTDKAQVLGDMPEFKRGGVVVQKWQ